MTARSLILDAGCSTPPAAPVERPLSLPRCPHCAEPQDGGLGLTVEVIELASLTAAGRPVLSYRVGCQVCGMAGPQATTREGAAACWATLAVLASLGRQAPVLRGLLRDARPYLEAAVDWMERTEAKPPTQRNEYRRAQALLRQVREQTCD